MLARGFLAELGDDVVELLLRTQALPLQHFHNGRDLPHVETVASSMDMESRSSRFSPIIPTRRVDALFRSRIVRN